MAYSVTQETDFKPGRSLLSKHRMASRYKRICRTQGDISFMTITKVGTAVAQWLRYCATNRNVAGSIADDVTGIFH